MKRRVGEPLELRAVAIDIEARRWKNPLPPTVPAGVRVLARQGVGQLDPAGAVAKVGLVLLAPTLEMGDQCGLDRRRQHRHAILAAFAVADDDLVRREVNVLHAQVTAFQQAKPRTVQE